MIVRALADEFGIKVIWGFAWGWSRDCAKIDVDALSQLAEDILRNTANCTETYARQGDLLGHICC